MSELIRHQSAALDARQSNQLLPTRPSRSLVRRVTREGENALVAQARVQGAAFVAHTAMTYITSLSSEEASAIIAAEAHDPRLADRLARRLGSTVDAFTAAATAELRTFGG